jgi:hypothetical protein
VNLIFNAGSLRSAFEKEVRLNTTITDLPVALTLTAPPTVVSGQSITYIADMRNETEETLTDLQLELTYPEGFTVSSVRPDPDSGTTRLWTINELSPGEGHRFTVQGTLSGVEREAKTITAILRRKVSDEYIDYVRSDAVTLLSSPLLSVRMTVNGSRDHVAAAGDILEYELTYRNSSNHNLIGLEMAVQLDGQMYDFDELNAPAGSFDNALNTVRFSSSGVPDFATLPPGASGTVAFTVPLRPTFVAGAGTQAFFVRASARLSTSNVPTGIDGNEVIAQDVITTKLASQPTLGQVIRYVSGNPEMTAGEETVFTVDWTLTNPGNELRNAQVTATLRPGVQFVSATGDDIIFNSNTQQVSWSVGTVPFGTGVGLPRRTGQFTIAVIPSTNQRGQDMPLLSNAVLDGTDSFTNLNVQSVVRPMGTEDAEGLEESRVQ